LVPLRYWKNISRKTKHYVPFIFTLPSGPVITLFSPGIGYHVGDVLTIHTGTENAVIRVTQVLVLWGDQATEAGIYAWTVTSNTFTNSYSMLPASGGSGRGAGFNVTII
jgi:hypothetical protein